MDLLIACMCWHEDNVTLFKYFGDDVCVDFVSNVGHEDSHGDEPTGIVKCIDEHLVFDFFCSELLRWDLSCGKGRKLEWQVVWGEELSGEVVVIMRILSLRQAKHWHGLGG